jgi:hypothetical protein
MKALSLKQPWAYLIFHGKDVENRKWATKYRGPLLIHASLNYDEEGDSWVRQYFPEIEIPSNLPRGSIVGKVDLVDCVTKHTSRWFFGPYGFVLSNPIEYIKPVIYKGQLGLFNVEECR